jgi:hypothetical protein
MPFDRNRDRKCGKIGVSLKKSCEQIMIFAALSDHCMEYASKFCWMNSTCSALQHNLSQGHWVMIKGIPHFCLHRTQRTGRKRPQIISTFNTDDESWVCRYDPETKQQSHQRKTQTSPWPKTAKHVGSNVQWILIFFFFPFPFIYWFLLSIINFLYYFESIMHRDVCSTRPDGEWKYLLWHIKVIGDWGKTSSTSFQIRGATTPALAHALLIVQHLLVCMKTTFIPHPPYSLDQAPVWF